MSKVIRMTILKTVVAVVIVLAVVFAVISLAFPQYIVSACESMGMYRVAVSYSSYKYFCSGNIEDLDRCARDSIFSGRDDLVVEYCEKLVADDEFEDYCSDEEYRQYILGSLSVSYYRTGETEKAVEIAESAIGDGFYRNNAFAVLAIEVVESEDVEVACSMYDWLSENKDSLESEIVYSVEDEAISYLDIVNEVLEVFLGIGEGG